MSSALREVRRLHIDHYGTLLPHVFMSDVLLHVGRTVAARAAGGEGEVAGILLALEQGMALGDRETRNVIAISFARDSRVEPFFAELRPLFGPRLRSQL